MDREAWRGCKPQTTRYSDLKKKENRNVSLFIKSPKSELFKNNVETSQNMSVSQMWPVNCQYMEIFYVSR